MSVNAWRSSSVAARTEYIDTYTSAISIRRYSFFPPARPVDDRAPTAVRSDACAFKHFGYSPRGTSSAPRTSTDRRRQPKGQPDDDATELAQIGRAHV